MLDTGMLAATLAATATSFAAILVLRRFAEPLGLLDHPGHRKLHAGSVPLVGGLAIFTGVLVGAFIDRHQLPHFAQILLATSTILVLVGALDDREDLSVRMRLVVQTAAILVMIGTTGVYIHTLGRVFGHDLVLGWLGIPLTVVAVIGLVNAFNMMDGIDGLAGGLALVCAAAILHFTNAPPAGAQFLLALLVAAILPYLAVNLGLLGRKIFMGDAGSMLIGYLLSWILIRLSQQSGSHLSPVDVLWCVALPVLDTLAVMFRRLREHKSPFMPDRGHIHHILMGMGLGPRATLIVLLALATTIAFAGSLVRQLNLGAGSNLIAFITLMIGYIALANRTWARQQARTMGRVQPQSRAAAAANDADITPMGVLANRNTPQDGAQGS
ncbi:undecaprenyl/decaprenyl-phosphate alpha-N-acetylglucosaminyl 1-phosphate transferase [Rhodanobacter sp. DHG33]|uniref:undecaprenyl/decaprenyl-phosphate alpha-N-acetylglucosaminyl 1-phosphate transferase n=1 Tax=Rhodanobacter sp. DHG33 TaxID=2775921 RepID=UPI00177B23E9|nr:undecaprenyl/decaprenyl-phosphate alpha-N-acetylglucosaminyl 1-phosphate transferase [Rhodanobacter sp. DHG33]MBD8897423.1 undecaprenyl/decaprenyl-phosphate alpha-N-acetylglucosaminyl 1-phosphate transferase [Rhodanobacter sp. DHG33]